MEFFIWIACQYRHCKSEYEDCNGNGNGKFSLSRKRREWLPYLPSQGLMTKTHDYLQYN